MDGCDIHVISEYTNGRAVSGLYTGWNKITADGENALNQLFRRPARNKILYLKPFNGFKDVKGEN